MERLGPHPNKRTLSLCPTTWCLLGKGQERSTEEDRTGSGEDYRKVTKERGDKGHRCTEGRGRKGKHYSRGGE